MAAPIAYRYNPKTFEYDGSEPCQLDPLESEAQGKQIWLLPAHATYKAPPAEREGYTRVFVPNTAEWVWREDHRGEHYKLNADAPDAPIFEMKEIGPLPQNAIVVDIEGETTELSPEENIRMIRDAKLYESEWLVIRHRDEKDQGRETTLTEKQYQEVLYYRQALRDFPKQEGFPWDGGGNATPWPTLSI